MLKLVRVADGVCVALVIYAVPYASCVSVHADLDFYAGLVWFGELRPATAMLTDCAVVGVYAERVWKLERTHIITFHFLGYSDYD